jgi:hypothetical protein
VEALTPFTDWATVPLVADITTTARVLNRSVRAINRDLAHGCMVPEPIPCVGRGRVKQRRLWSKDALQAYLGGEYLKFQSAARKPKTRHFFGKAIAGLALALLPSVASADMVSGCVTSLPASFGFSSTYHLVVGVWEDAAGCNPSGPHARPTSGPYSREWIGDVSSVTFYAAQFKTCGSSQGDVREVDDLGNIVGYHDFIFNTGVECDGRTTGADGDGVSVGVGLGGGPDVLHEATRPTSACLSCGIEQHKVTPVPEPATFALFGAGLALLMRRKRDA